MENSEAFSAGPDIRIPTATVLNKNKTDMEGQEYSSPVFGTNSISNKLDNLRLEYVKMEETKDIQIQKLESEINNLKAELQESNKQFEKLQSEQLNFTCSVAIPERMLGCMINGRKSASLHWPAETFSFKSTTLGQLVPAVQEELIRHDIICGYPSLKFSCSDSSAKLTISPSILHPENIDSDSEKEQQDLELTSPEQKRKQNNGTEGPSSGDEEDARQNLRDCDDSLHTDWKTLSTVNNALSIENSLKSSLGDDSQLDSN